MPGEGDCGKRSLKSLLQRSAPLGIGLSERTGKLRGHGAPFNKALHKFPHNVFTVRAASSVARDEDLSPLLITIL